MNSKIKESFLYRLDPRTKMLLLLVFIIVGCMIMDPFVTLGLLVLAYILYRTTGFSRRQIWGLTKPLLLAFFLFFILTFPFAKPLPGETIYFYLLPGNHVAVTASAVLSGLASAIRFVFFIWTADLITSVTPTGDIVLTMNKAKMPPEASIAIGIAFSYIPVLKNEIGTVIEAQKSRGASFESKNPFKKIQAYIPVIVPGLFISIVKGREIARAIEARGFTYDPTHRTYRKDIHLVAKDFLVMFLAVLFAVVVSYFHSKRGWFGTTFIWNLLTK
ncbi:MAG: energy-coupling factor transporter transmembrane protein EcfT [Oscillibacter sp.]|jgi:energy-coupling factor transport system permease protein|nr:energy-coupling factor transporter transmembrane protein EcfT [Oscillibacter sp.]